MAEGRMLKRNISHSRRLAELKTDSARMLWTWIIPYLDVEGRFYASPDIIKGKVVPRLKTFTEENIEVYLNDMAIVGLIILYKSDDELYLQYRKFDDFQQLRKDREGKPLPAPDKKNTLTPTQLPESACTTPAQSNISEVNIREVNLREANAREEKKDTPVDNSLSKEAFLKKYQELMQHITELFTHQREQRMITLFVESNIKCGNLNAILHSLERLIDAKANGQSGVINPKAYLEKVFSVENGNYNEQENTAKAEEYKKPVKGMTKLGDVFRSM